MTDPQPLPETGDHYPEERRLATIMFADIQGFTALAARRDAELISDLIRDVWLMLDDVISSSDGYIDKHLGDGVMVVWGAPYSHEDDAARAVNAGLAMQAALADYTAKTRFPEGRNLQMRVGINTGQVLACYVGRHSEYTVIGDTVNIASRLEELAEPGKVVIGESTYRLVRGTFRVTALPELVLRGQPAPIPLYEVASERVQPSTFRYQAGAGLKTRMVGRDAEMAQLRELYENVRAEQLPLLALVVGHAGVGKSRLLLEFITQLETSEQNAQLVSARGLAQVTHVPYFLWKSLWFNRFGISDGEPEHEVRDKFLRGVNLLWGGHLGAVSSVETAHVIGALCGIPWPDSPFTDTVKDPARNRRRAFVLTRFLLHRMAERGQVVLLLDDLHWVDRGSLDLLAYLLEDSSEPLPLLVLGGARPEQLDRHTLVFNRAAFVEVEALPVAGSIVAEAYPDLSHLPNAVLDMLAQRAEGNPYFLEEMVKSLVSNANLMQAPVKQQVTHISENLPNSLRALLQSRLDALSPEARNIALLGAVVGRVFWQGAITAVLRDVQGVTGTLDMRASGLLSQIEVSLAELSASELAFPRAGTVFTGEREFIFKHSLLRDVAYDLLPHKFRRQAHLSVARWLTKRAGPDFGVVIGEHYENAGMVTQAIMYYRAAEKHALGSGADAEAHALDTRIHNLSADAA